MGQPAPGLGRPAEHGGLAEHLGLHASGCEGRGLDDPGECGTAGGGIKQMVGGQAVFAHPAAIADPARGRGSAGQLKRVQDGVGERAGHLHRPHELAPAAKPQIAGRVHDERGVMAQAERQQIAEQALGDPARVEAHARGPGHIPGRPVHPDLLPARRLGRRGGLAVGDQPQCHGERQRVSGEILRVASRLDLRHQRAVNQSVRHDRPGHQ